MRASGGALAAALLAGGVASGAPEEVPSDAGAGAPLPSAGLDACIASFGSAQRLRREGKLVSSRAELLRCAQPSCPAPIIDRCVVWLGEVERAIPTVIVTALDPNGQDTSDVRVWLDGSLRATALDGRPWALDPGQHLLRFELAGARPIERRMIVAETEKNRRVELWFDRAGETTVVPVAAPSVPSESPARIVTWSAYGVGAAALVVGVVTGAIALDERAELDDRCPAGACSWDELDRYREAVTLARVSTLAFIGAGVGLSVGLLTQLLVDEGPPLGVTAWRPVLRVGAGGLELAGHWP